MEFFLKKASIESDDQLNEERIPKRPVEQIVFFGVYDYSEIKSPYANMFMDDATIRQIFGERPSTTGMRLSFIGFASRIFRDEDYSFAREKRFVFIFVSLV
jgi:hypothetical protein